MRHDVMMEMTLDELDRYAAVCGIDTTNAKTKKAKVSLIERRRERVANVEAIGMTFEVPVRVMHDKRVTDLLNSGVVSDKQADELMLMLLGQEQHDEMIRRCTDDDGITDVDAVALVFHTLISSEELKNF